MKTRFPKDISEFERGVRYQTKQFDGTWSYTKTIAHLCNDTRVYINYLISTESIRIVEDERD